MILEVGKTYATRNGKSVKIISMDDDDMYPFDGNNQASYTPNGVYHLGITSGHDIIGEVVSPKTADFKVSDKVFDILSGEIFTITRQGNPPTKRLIISHAGGAEHCSITIDGKKEYLDKYPRFISLESARAKGYDVPNQKVKKSKTVTIAFYHKIGEACVLKYPCNERLDIVQKEVTFEWEEDEI